MDQWDTQQEQLISQWLHSTAAQDIQYQHTQQGHARQIKPGAMLLHIVTLKVNSFVISIASLF